MRIWGVLLGTLLLAQIADARPIVVRSGEHNDFTRLVLQMDTKRPWQFSKTGPNSGTILVPGHQSGFDTQTVFRRLSRNRVSGFKAHSDRLEIDLTCDCSVDAFSLGQRMLVLDIRGEPGKTTDKEQRAYRLRPESEKQQSHLHFALATAIPSLPETDTESEDLLQDSVELEPTPRPLPDLPLFDNEARQTVQGLGLPPLQISTDPEKPSTATLDALRKQLLEQIGSAATRGILTPNGLSPDTPPTQAQTEILGLEGKPAHQAHSPQLLACPPTEDYAVEGWSSASNFSQAVSSARADLFGEFDEINRPAVLELARNYIYFGFTDEALRVLDLVSDPSESETAARSIAQLLEPDGSAQPALLPSFGECDDQVALWTYIDEPEAQKPETLDAALRALQALPTHLKALIGPQLSEAIRDQGNLKMAEAVMRVVNRAEPLQTHGVQLETAEILLDRGKDKQAAEIFENVSISNVVEAPIAMARYVDLQVSQKGHLSPDIAVLTDTYLAEHKNTDLAPILLRANILALAKSGQYREAFGKLNGSDQLQSEIQHQTAEDYFSILTEEARDVDFLKFIFLSPQLPETVKRHDLLLSIGKRLSELGFTHEAAEYLNEIPGPTFYDERALISAQQSFSRYELSDALDLIENAAGPQIDNMRSNIHEEISRIEGIEKRLSGDGGGSELSGDGIVTAAGDANSGDATLGHAQRNKTLAYALDLAGEAKSIRADIDEILRGADYRFEYQ